jgi:hypothetical protein
VRLADVILRRGHLSERVLAEVYMTGERPGHLDRCDICAERAVELSRWLDEVRTLGVEESDAAFPPERLAAQQAQVLRRLEQLDRPARVIAFPSQTRDAQLESQSHGIRPAWVGFAAAAGLVLGLVGGQLSARLTITPAPPVTAVLTPVQTEQSAAVTSEQSTASLIDLDEYDRPQIDALGAIDQLTPHSLPVSQQVVLHAGRVAR